MKTTEEVEKEFVEYLWTMPQHFFAEINCGVPVMQPISYALYQAFCHHYNYEFGVFDLASKKDRTRSYINDKGRKITFELGWGSHPDDYKILLPVYYREKEKYLDSLKCDSEDCKKVEKGCKNHICKLRKFLFY